MDYMSQKRGYSSLPTVHTLGTIKLSVKQTFFQRTDLRNVNVLFL